jgi:hypothetical protein
MYIRNDPERSKRLSSCLPGGGRRSAGNAYSDAPSYQQETHTYEYKTAPPVVVAQPPPVATGTIVVRRPVIVEPPRVVVDEYPVYAAPVYAYVGPGWRGGWGYPHHFRGGW